MGNVKLYEEWLSFNIDTTYEKGYDVFSDLKYIHSNINEGWVQTGKPWLNALSRSCMALFSMQDFKNEVMPTLNESEDYDSLIRLYAIYEVSLLQTHRPEWFLDDTKIIVMPDYSSNKMVLCKNESIFIVSSTTWNYITESLWDDIKSTISSVATDVYDTVKDAAGKAWKWLSEGAIAVMEFLSKVYGIVKDLLNEDAIIIAGGFISIISGIIKFCGAADTKLGSQIICSMSGSIGMINSYAKIKTSVEGIKDIKKSQLSTTGVRFAPNIVDGSVSMLLAAHDIYRGQADKSDSGVGGTTNDSISSAMESAKKIGDSLKKSIASTGEVTVAVEEIVEQSSDTLKIPDVSDFGVGLLLILFVKAGMDILGGIFNTVCEGINLVVQGIKWLLNMTNNLKRFIKELLEKAAGENAVTKIIANAVNFVATPLYTGMEVVIDKIKPISEPTIAYLSPIGKTYKAAIPIVNKNLKSISGNAVEIKNVIIKPQQDIKVDSKERDVMKNAVKDLQGSTEKESSKNPIIDAFKDTDSGFKGIKGDVKKVNVVIDDISVDDLGKMIKSSDLQGKVKFQYGGTNATDVQDGGKNIKLKTVEESIILSFRDWKDNKY
jgi:hypothetical protein